MLRKLILVGAVITCIGLAVWSFWLEPASLTVKHYAEPIRVWPQACNGLKIAVLADLHVGSPYNDLDQLHTVVQETNKAQPDIVLLVGDYVIHGVVGGTFVEPEAAALGLANLAPPLGTYAVLGNHDWWLDAARVAAALSSVGITMLEDRNTQITNGNCKFTLAGISDYWEGPHDIKQALAGRNTDLPVLAFSHNPDLIQELPDSVNFLIAGHTHGGQVNLPLLGRLVVPSDFGSRYAAGSIKHGNLRGFVSTGIGTSIIPVRFRVPPEISVVSLYSEKQVAGKPKQVGH